MYIYKFYNKMYAIKYEYAVRYDINLNFLTKEKVLDLLYLIRDSKNYFHTDWTKIPVVITTPEAPFLVKYIDDNFCAQFGYSISDLKDKDIITIRENDKTTPLRIVNKTKNGKLVEHDFDIFDIMSSNGTLQCRIGLSKNIKPYFN